MKHNWEYKRLDEVCTIKSGYTPSSDDLATDGDFPYFKVAEMNLSGNEKYLIHSPSYISGNIKTFPANSIVFPKNGAAVSTNKKRILQVASVVDLNTAVMIAHQNISAEYLYYILINIDFATLVKRGAVPTLNIPELKKINIPIPPMKVQEQIVAELDKINEVIADCRELLRNLDTLAQSLFYDYFGDPITNPKGWDRKPLMNAVIEMFLGPFGSALKTDCYVSKDNAFAMVYEQKHAIKKTLEQENHFINKEKFMSLKRFEVIPLDFIMSCRGTIGQLYQIPENSPRGIIHPSLMKIRLNSTTYNPVFFKFLLPIIIKEQQTKGNCVQMAITAKELGSKKLPVPPLALQEKFAARIEQIEEQKKAVEQTIAELQTLLDSRMDYWFN